MAKKRRINESDITTAKLLTLVQDIFECIESVESPEKNKSIVTILNHEILILEIDDKRFTVNIKDTSQFN